MDADTALVLGLIVVGFSIPSMVSAMSDRRTPRASIVTILIAGCLILYAVKSKPAGYALEDIPDVFFNVVAKFIP
jgi:hypothetical protein